MCLHVYMCACVCVCGQVCVCVDTCASLQLEQLRSKILPQSKWWTPPIYPATAGKSSLFKMQLTKEGVKLQGFILLINSLAVH